jgi:putative glutamine amidotransferase
VTTPVIGVTPSPLVHNSGAGALERDTLTRSYARAVTAAGGVPIILPLAEEVSPRLFDIVDGLLFSGGADIDPARYGDSGVHPKTYDIHPLRDAFEIGLMREAIERDLPALCICRGIQLLNVARGGTLIQDVADQVSPDIPHRQQEVGLPASEPSHDVSVVTDSLLESVYSSSSIAANSFHHQAVRELGVDLRVCGRTADGLIEAIELPDRAFILGVQWHPELMFSAHPEHLRPFEALVVAATARQLAGTAL